MKHIIPINTNINQMTNIELEKNFTKKNPIYGRQNYYPVFAKRIHNFKELLFSEIIDKKNINDFVMGEISAAWLIAISIMDYCEDDNIKMEMTALIKKNWKKENINSFINYIKNEKKIVAYFVD